jgi:hypothetical protein
MATQLLTVEQRSHLKPFTTVAVVLLALIAFTHLIRLLLDWEVTVNSTVVRKWASWPVLVITAWLSLMVWREARK